MIDHKKQRFKQRKKIRESFNFFHDYEVNGKRSFSHIVRKAVLNRVIPLRMFERTELYTAESLKRPGAYIAFVTRILETKGLSPNTLEQILQSQEVTVSQDTENRVLDLLGLAFSYHIERDFYKRPDLYSPELE